MRLELLGLCLSSTTDGVPFDHDIGLVVLSLATAALASFVALNIAERRRDSDGAALFWHLAGAIALGGGIWSMHFIAMLSFHAPFVVTYDPALTVTSLAVAVLGVFIGLAFVGGQRKPQRWLSENVRLGIAGAIVGLAVAAMHYVGMAAMNFSGQISYHPVLFLASIGVAILAATAAFWLALRVVTMLHRMAAAVVMALAIGGMHFTGMAATAFSVEPAMLSAQGANTELAIAVASGTYLLMILGLVSVFSDRRYGALVVREANRLRQANAQLEQEIAARQIAETDREEARRRAEEANRAKGEFLALVSHELRTPLSAIIGFAALLRAERRGDADHIGEILQAGERLDALIRDMLDFARSDVGTPFPEDWIDAKTLCQAVYRFAGPTAADKKITLILEGAMDPDAGHLCILGDERRLRRALFSLVSNAIKFAPSGSQVTVACEMLVNGDRAIVVADQGSGMDADSVARALEPFGQSRLEQGRSIEGAGLGLPLAHRLARLHGGRVDLASTLGIGTRARLVLPAARWRFVKN